MSGIFVYSFHFKIHILTSNITVDLVIFMLQAYSLNYIFTAFLFPTSICATM